MRFKITFNRTGKLRMLPMDYQYYIGAWIYKVIGNADHEFASFLHSQGYSDGNKQFKLFNYSPLNFGKPKLWTEKSLFEIGVDQVSLQVSFFIPDAAERFIIGLFNNQQVYIGDKFNGIELSVSQVERLIEQNITKTLIYKALSPIVVSILNEGEKYAKYLSPDDEGYTSYLKNNLFQKWKTVPNSHPFTEEFEFNFKIKSEFKSKMTTIKPYTPQKSKVRGYVYDFELTTLVELHSLILSAGIGEKNSTGFGWCEMTVPKF